MKTKYQRMSKEEKKKAIARYYNSPNGKVNKLRFNRLLLCGIMCFIYSIVVSIDCFIKKGSYWNYVLAGIVFIFGLVFIIGRYKIRAKSVNNFVIKNK